VLLDGFRAICGVVLFVALPRSTHPTCDGWRNP